MPGSMIKVVGIILLGIACWLVPPFRIVPLEQARSERQQAVFNAAEFAKSFWTNRLVVSLDQAVDASEVLKALADDPKPARDQFGRRVGMGGTYFFFLHGIGTVVSMQSKGVGVSVHGPEGQADVLLPTGLIFGNAVRDGTGLLDVSDFPNSQNFNQLSTELNRMVETQVIPKLTEETEVGRQVEFVGCAEVSEEGGNVIPLTVIPVFVKVDD